MPITAVVGYFLWFDMVASYRISSSSVVTIGNSTSALLQSKAISGRNLGHLYMKELPVYR
jgi:hypothetical protein